MATRLAAKLPVLATALLLPGAAASLLLPDLLRNPPSAAGVLAWRAVLAFPVTVLPVLLAVARLQPHLSRAAFGLGAGWLDRLRWIWLPRLGPGIALSLLLAVLFTFGGHPRH